MNISYIIIAHKNHDQLVRLVNKLDHEGVAFFIHIARNVERSFSRRVFESLRGYSNCHFVRRETIRWGSFGLVRAALNGIEDNFRLNVDSDFLVLLSGQDYPLKNNVDIKN